MCAPLRLYITARFALSAQQYVNTLAGGHLFKLLANAFWTFVIHCFPQRSDEATAITYPLKRALAVLYLLQLESATYVAAAPTDADIYVRDFYR